MLGIWHGGEWLKRDLAWPFYGREERGSPISGWLLHALMRNSFHWFSCVNVLMYMWILWLICL